LKRVINSTSDSFREMGSKFIGYLFPVENRKEFEEKLDEIKSTYPDATHHCYAWRLNPVNPEEFAQDDGEPGGTAGPPILNRLKSFEVMNAAIIVVRYYGGTNLGKSGLIEAYGRSTENCLDKATLKAIKLIQEVKITYPYSQQKVIDRLVRRYDLKELKSRYMKNVTLHMGCPLDSAVSFKEEVHKISHLGIKSSFLKKGYL